MSRKRSNIIYKATNTIENKYYIGQTIFTLSARKASHKRKALILNKPSPFYDAIREYGFQAFIWEIICVCDSQEELDVKEREAIEKLGKENCYNAYSGGKSKFTLSDKTKEKLSRQKLKENNPRYGKKMSEEEKKNLIKASMEVCSKKVIKIETGEIYESISECARQNNCSIATISLHCNNKIKTQKYCFL